MPEKNEQQTVKPLDVVSFNAIAGAFARLQTLGDKIIASNPGVTTQAEKEKLIEFIATEMLAHCGEFLACYEITHREYLPACNALLKIARRCGFNPALPTPPPAPSSNN